MSPFIPKPRLDLIDLLLGEHGAMLALMRHIETRLGAMSLAELKLTGEALESLLMSHAIEEDQLLFHALPEERTGVRETLDAMFAEHNEQRQMLEELRALTEPARARSLLLRLIELTREHFAVEERVLFGLAKSVLSDDRLGQLGREYARRRGLH